MDTLIVILVIVIIVSNTIASVKKAAQKRANEENAGAEAPKAPPPSPKLEEIGKWFDDEFYGEREKPAAKPAAPKPAPPAHQNSSAKRQPILKGSATLRQNMQTPPVTSIKSSLTENVKYRGSDVLETDTKVTGIDMSFQEQDLVRAILYSEILAKPKALR